MISMVPINISIISISRPKQPILASYPAPAQNTRPIITNETLSGAANTMQQAISIIRVSNILFFQQFTTLILEHISSEKGYTEIDAEVGLKDKLRQSQDCRQSKQY